MPDTALDVKAIRESLGLTQRDFANLLGTTVASVSRWENGRMKPGLLAQAAIKQAIRLLAWNGLQSISGDSTGNSGGELELRPNCRAAR